MWCWIYSKSFLFNQNVRITFIFGWNFHQMEIYVQPEILCYINIHTMVLSLKVFQNQKKTNKIMHFEKWARFFPARLVQFWILLNVNYLSVDPLFFSIWFLDYRWCKAYIFILLYYASLTGTDSSSFSYVPNVDMHIELTVVSLRICTARPRRLSKYQIEFQRYKSISLMYLYSVYFRWDAIKKSVFHGIPHKIEWYNFRDDTFRKHQYLMLHYLRWINLLSGYFPLSLENTLINALEYLNQNQPNECVCVCKQ